MIHATVYHEPDTPNFHGKIIDTVNGDIIFPLNMPKDSRILDIGCGSGYWMETMRSQGFTNVHGITMGDEDIQNCLDKGLSVTREDFTFTDQPDGSVDFIYCRHALEHSPAPIMTLLEFNRIMKMGARGYIELPAPDQDRKHEDNLNHFSILGKTMWHKLFLRAGLDVKWTFDYSFDLTDEIAPGIMVDQKETFYMFTIEKIVELK